MQSVVRTTLGLGLALLAGTVLHQAVWSARESRAAPGAPLSPRILTKLAPHVREAIGTGQSGSYIIRLRRPASPEDVALLRSTGAQVRMTYDQLPMAAVSASGGALVKLAALPQVAHVSPDLQVKRTLDAANPAVGASGGAWAGDVYKGFTGYTGKGVGIAVLDSGIWQNDDLGTGSNWKAWRIKGGYDFIKGMKTYTGNDQGGHGTQVAGVIAGNGYDSSQFACGTGGVAVRHFVGVAPEANLVNVRILDTNCQGTVSNAIAGINWCISNKAAYNIRVLNLSIGQRVSESYVDDPLCQACEKAWKAGIVVVVAAGNDGRSVAGDKTSATAYGTINSPGDDPYVITVGATNDGGTAGVADDVMASYSSRGPSRVDHILKPDLVAPGNKIIAMRDAASTLEQGIGKGNIIPVNSYISGKSTSTSPQYYVLSGTSFATPMVAAAAAILIQKDPTLDPDDVKARLMESAVKKWRADGNTPDVYSRGAGLLNVARALQCTSRVSGAALSPTCYNANGTVTINTSACSWLSEALASNQAVWSDQAVWADQAVWGDQAVWADQAVWSDQAVWADQAVWSDQAVWADVSTTAVYGD